jgi:hypothetical protein
MLTLNDYETLIHICNYALAQGHQLNINQINDIDRLRTKLYNESESRRKINAVVRNKKVGKRKRIRNR